MWKLGPEAAQILFWECINSNCHFLSVTHIWSHHNEKNTGIFFDRLSKRKKKTRMKMTKILTRMTMTKRMTMTWMMRRTSMTMTMLTNMMTLTNMTKFRTGLRIGSRDLYLSVAQGIIFFLQGLWILMAYSHLTLFMWYERFVIEIRTFPLRRALFFSYEVYQSDGLVASQVIYVIKK